MTWYDISRTLGNDTDVYPGDPPVTVETVASLADGSFHLSRLGLGSHAGTHVDAPAHVVRGGQTLAEIPLTRFTGPAWVIEVAPGGAITPDMLWEVWPSGDVDRVLLRTGNAKLAWGALPVQPLTVEAAEWLVGVGVTLVGIDALSVEPEGDGSLPVHHALLGHGVLLLEGLDLGGVPVGPYELLCLPLKCEAPDGSPARAVLRPR